MSENILVSNGTCYTAAGVKLGSDFIPCGNDAFGHQTCCGAGDNCLADKACFGVHGSGYGSQLTYFAGCTDSSYKDPSCPVKPFDQPWVALTLCDNSGGQWAACSQKGNPSTLQAGSFCSCTDASKTTVAFKDSSSLANFASLPKSTGASIAFQAGHTPSGNPTPNSAGSSPTSGSGSSSGGSKSSGSSGTGSGSSRSKSTIVSSKPTTIVSKSMSTSGGVVITRTTSITTALSETSTANSSSGGSNGSSSGLGTGAKAGIGAGIGVVALIIIAGVIFFLLRRRRRQRRPSGFGGQAPDAYGQKLTKPGPSEPEPMKKVEPEYAAPIFAKVTTPPVAETAGQPVSEMGGRPAQPWSMGRQELEGSPVDPTAAAGSAARPAELSSPVEPTRQPTGSTARPAEMPIRSGRTNIAENF